MVSEYKKSCGYGIGSLQDTIYLIPYNPDTFSYSIDNGSCSEISINDMQGILNIEGSNVVFRNTEQLDGRLRYNSEISMYIQEGGRNIYDILHVLLSNRWYVVIEDKMNVQYVQSVEFYSEFSYNMTLTDNKQCRVQLTFKGSSNFPEMIMHHRIQKALTRTFVSKDCNFTLGNVTDLMMCESKYVLMKEHDHNIEKIFTTGGRQFNNIQFMNKSFSFTESYSNGSFVDTITFSIALSEYKYYWHYNLVEFHDNRYVATFKTTNGNFYGIGFPEGASPSYVIETSTNVGNLNKITITLRYVSNEGLYMSPTADNIIEEDDTIIWRPASLQSINDVPTKECRGEGMADILVVQKYTASGAPLDEYLVLDGYADRFPSLNIVGTYSLDDDLGFPLSVDYPNCVKPVCALENGIDNPYTFDKYHTSYTFTFFSSCGFSFIGIPEWIIISPIEGGFQMDLDDEKKPTQNTGASFFIKGDDSNLFPIIINYLVTSDDDMTGWDVNPKVFSALPQGQTIYADYIGVSKDELEFSSDTLTLINITDKINISVPGNYTTDEVVHHCTIFNKSNGESVILTVNQSISIQDWVTVSGYICKDGNKYTKMQLYVNNLPTQTFKEGELIEIGSDLCKTDGTRWIVFDTICDGVNEYQYEKKQKLDDDDVWVDTDERRIGGLVELNSEKCNPDHVEYRKTSDSICENGLLCEVWAKYVDNVITDKTALRNCVEDTTSCPTEFPTKWEITTKTQCVNRGNDVCDSFYLEEEYISYDNGATWESNGIFRTSSEIAKVDDLSCNCPNHDTYKYERWYWDGVSFMCEDSSYDNTMAVKWIPIGFYYNYRYKGQHYGYWTNKSITKVEAVSDFKEKFNDIHSFAEDCILLETVDELDCINVGNITKAFSNCPKLKNMPLKNLANVDNAKEAFKGTAKLSGVYDIPMPKLLWMDQMFYGSGIEGWHFGGAKLQYPPSDPITNSNIKIITGLDYADCEEVTSANLYPVLSYNRWMSDIIETLEIKNIGINMRYDRMPNLSRASIDYIYENAQGDKQMVWKYSQLNLNKWGSLPTGKSNIKFEKV